MLTLPNVVLYVYMSEENLTTTPTQESPDNDHFADNKEIIDDTLAQRQAQLEAEQAADAAEAAQRAKRLDRRRTGVATGAAVVTLGTIGGALGIGIAGHAENEADKTQQWQEQAEQNENDFYQENGILPPEMEEAKDELNLQPTPSPAEIPSPTQQSVDIQLPDVGPPPSEKTR
jgi:hypothetical protein